MLTTDTLQITPEILSLIVRIDEFKGAWRALGTLAPDRLAALQHVATIESIGSSKLTGASRNTLKQHFRAPAVGINRGRVANRAEVHNIQGLATNSTALRRIHSEEGNEQLCSHGNGFIRRA